MSSGAAKRSRNRKLRSRSITRSSRLEMLESRTLLTSLPYGAHAQDTGEFMLGDVVASVVLFESNGDLPEDWNELEDRYGNPILPDSEDWNELVRDEHGQPILDDQGRTISVSGPNYIEQTKDTVREGLGWWEETLANFGSWLEDPVPTPVHSLNFIYDFEFAHNPIDTPYEPIAGPSNDFDKWVEDFLEEAGFATDASRDTDIRNFNHAQRLKYDADWAFTIFIANDLNDADGQFHPDGSFRYAFAYSGGRFFVAPASRPAASFTHETAHMFWARDEYQYSGASYLDRRGYYNTQNWNAWDNPHLEEQQDSLMEGGLPFWNAYHGGISSESSLAMIGWQDSDADGVFDVLDVPLSLSGTGYYDSTSGAYRFLGQSAVQTLINQNPSGLQNDITINEVSLAEYSLDGGSSWLIAEHYGDYQVDLDLTIPIQPGQQILLRTRSVDATTGHTVATSESLHVGNTSLPTSVSGSGIQGFAWYDENGDGVWDAGEPGIPGWTMQLVDAQGQPLAINQRLEPDDYAEQELVNDALDGVTLSAVGYGVKDDRVGVVPGNGPGAENHVLGYVSWGTTDIWTADWTNDSRQLRIDFDSPVMTLSIDAVAAGNDSYGRLEIYDADHRLLDRYTTGLLQDNDVETMSLSRPTEEIAYAIVHAHMNSQVQLDNLRVGPESSTVTGAGGAYHLPDLPDGSYWVQAIPSGPWEVTEPQTATQEIIVSATDDPEPEPNSARPSDFGGQLTSREHPFQNPLNAQDVDDNGSVQPRDALLIINELNRHGSYELSVFAGGTAPPPYFDTSGDDLISPYDALLVINKLNDQSDGAGEPDQGDIAIGADQQAEGEMPTESLPLAIELNLLPTDQASAARNAPWLITTSRAATRPTHDPVPDPPPATPPASSISQSRPQDMDSADATRQPAPSTTATSVAETVDQLFTRLSKTASSATRSDLSPLDQVIDQISSDLMDPATDL